MTSATSRVHATSYTSATKPEMAAAVIATRGEGKGGAAGARRDRSPRRAFALEGAIVLRGSRASSAWMADPREAIHNAPAAAAPLSAAPAIVAPRRPIAGINQKPAAIAPAAAPAVFAAYSTPASAAAEAYQPVATGKVAPIAAAGMPTSTRLIVSRTIANRIEASPLA